MKDEKDSRSVFLDSSFILHPFRQSHLRPSLDDVKPTAGHGPFDVLGRTHHPFDLQPDPSDRTQQVLAEAAVLDQWFARVIEGPMLRLRRQEAIIQTCTGEPLQILAVGVGAEDDPRAVEADALAWIRDNLKGQTVLATDETK